MILFNMVSKPQSTQVDIDEELFIQIGSGDEWAFEKLYRSTERTMYAYILSIVKNHQDTLDILHDTYVKIRSAAHLYKPMGKPLAWMFSIANNLHRDKMRRQQRVADFGAVDVGKLSYVSSPEDRLVLQSALSILSEEERKIVLLYAVSGMKHKEIAQSIGIPLSTSLSKYYRALKKLRTHLAEKEGVK